MNATAQRLLEDPKVAAALNAYEQGYESTDDPVDAILAGRTYAKMALSASGIQDVDPVIVAIENHFDVDASVLTAAPTTLDAVPNEEHAELREAQAPVSFFESIAMPLLARGFKVAPCHPYDTVDAKGKVLGKTVDLHDPLNQISNDPAQIHAWGLAKPNANVCVYAIQEPGGVCFVDKDGAISLVEKYERETGKQFPKTLLVCSSITDTTTKGHWYFYQTPKTIALSGNIGEDKTGGLFSFRVKNQYVASIGSIHPATKKPYAVADEVPIAPIPDDLVDWMYAQVAAKEKPTAEQMQTVKLSKGVRYNSLISYLGKLWAAGTPRQAVIDAGLAWAEEHFDLPEGAFNAKLVQGEIEHYLDHGYEQGQPTPDLKMSQGQTPDVVQPLQLLADPDAGWQYSITREEFDAQAELEFPVYPLKEGAGPTWDDEIMYGLAGDIVRKAAVYCEAHPAGMYLDLLVSFGNLVGRGPYFTVNSTQHHANEFMVRVGDSSISRKGTGRDAVNAVLKLIDPDWYKERVMSGFGSAESIINELRDDSRQQVRNKKKDNIFESVLVPGVRDKRLMIREPELASIFQLAGKTESRADIVLRDGWDSAPLHNRVKGKTDGLSNSNACQFPHMSISADTTRHELIQKMPKGADQNGFGNRFLY